MNQNDFVVDKNGTLISKDALKKLGKTWLYMILPFIIGFFFIGLVDEFYQRIELREIQIFLFFSGFAAATIVYQMVKDSHIYSKDFIDNISTVEDLDAAFNKRSLNVLNVYRFLFFLSCLYYVVDLIYDFSTLNLLVSVVFIFFFTYYINVFSKEIKDLKQKLS